MKCCFDTCVSFQFSIHHHHATTATLAPQKLIFHKLLPTCQKQLLVAEPRWISLRLPTCVCSCLPQPHAVCGQHCLMPYAKLELHSVSHEPAGMLWMDIYLSLSFYLGQFFFHVSVACISPLLSLASPYPGSSDFTPSSVCYWYRRDLLNFKPLALIVYALRFVAELNIYLAERSVDLISWCKHNTWSGHSGDCVSG